MKTRLLAYVMTLTAFIGQQEVRAQGSGSLPPTVLLHGYNDAYWTWNTAYNYLTVVEGFPLIDAPQLATRSQTIGQQASGVATALGAYGTAFANPLVVGHSMGGLVARELSTQVPLKAIITVGSPHHGHPAQNAQHTAGYWAFILGLSSGIQVVVENLFQCNQGAFDLNGNWVNGPCYTVWEYAGYVSGVIGLAEEVKARYFPGPAVDQVTPGSSFLDGFNGATHINSEVATEKIAVVGHLENWEVNSTFFRAAFQGLNAEDAAYIAGGVTLMGALTMYQGFDIINQADPNDPFYHDRLTGGAAVVSAGAFLGGLSQWYNDLIGGWPNDAFVPTWTQAFPGAQVSFVEGVSHVEEQSSLGLLTIVTAAGNRLRIP